jgi:hypothetical protein
VTLDGCLRASSWHPNQGFPFHEETALSEIYGLDEDYEGK